MIVITTFLAIVVEWSAQYIPFEFETALSQPIAEKLSVDANEVDEYLQRLADTITPYMNLPENIEITVHYVNEDTVNAAATLGGHVMIYRGLLDKLADERTLAMLIGHEIGHVKLRHPVKALSKGVIISLVLNTVLGQSSDSVANLITDTSTLTMLSFTREQEQVSDEEGIKALNACYGEVQGATNLFEILQQEHQTGEFAPPEFLSSHPDIKNRINHLNKIAQIQGWTRQVKPKPIPEYILKKITADKQRKI